jgi:AcrR family transcriptional regulator
MIEKALTAALAGDNPTPVARIATELGYESVCSLNLYFPELCRAIALKQEHIRSSRREELRMALTAAILEEPPPATAALARRLGCSHGKLTYYFPDLCRRLMDARRDWEARAREGVWARLQELIASRKGASVAEICCAARISQQWLWVRFPELARQIAAGRRERRIQIRDQQRAVLQHDVRRAVIELSSRGLRPSFIRVNQLLSEQAAKDWKLIREELDAVIRELGCGLEP